MRIANLTEQTTIATSDLVPFSGANGTRAITMGNLATAILATQTTANGLEVNRSSPLTGASVAVIPVTAGNSTWLNLSPLGVIAALTVVLPGDGSTGGSVAADGQEVVITSTQTITALTLSSQGKTFVGAPTTTGPTLPMRLRYDAVTNAWFRIG